MAKATDHVPGTFEVPGTWPLLLAAGLLLGALAVFAPLPALAAIIGLMVVFAFLRGWPVSGMVLLILASLLTHFKADVGPISVRPEHVAVLLVGALLAWELIFHGRPFRLDWPAAFALAWFGINVIAAAVNAPDFSDSLRHIVRLALMPLTYIVGINLLRTPRQWRLALTAFLLLAVAEATYGVLTRVLYAFGIDMGVQIAWVLTEPVPFGTLEEGNMFGSHSGSWLILLLALLLAGLAGRREQRIEANKRMMAQEAGGRRQEAASSRLHPLFLAAGCLITALAGALSLSRGAWVALLIALALLFVFYSPRPLDQYVRGTLLAFGAPLLVVGLLFALQVLPADIPLLARLRSFTQVATDATVSQRLADASLAMVNWEVHPWLGWGPGSFYQLHGLRNWEPAWIASQSVRTLQETGILGLLAYGGFVVTLLWAGVKGIRGQVGRPRTRAALLGLTIGFILLQIAYQSTDGTWLAAVWVHAALLTSGARLLVKERQMTDDDRRKTKDKGRNLHSAIPNPQSPISLLFIHSSDEMYGSDVVLLELARRLDRSRFAPIVALPTDLPYETGKARLSDELAKLGIPVVRVDFAVLRRRYLSPQGLPRLLLRLWRGSRGLAAVIREHDVRIVHANTVAVLGGAVAAKLAHVPLVWHVHEIITEPAWFRRLIGRLVTAWADRVVAISTPVAEHLLAAGAVAGARAKTVVIPDAVDTDHFTPQTDSSAVRAAWGIGPEDVLVGTVGRLHTWKGQEVLVEAARLLREREEQSVNVPGTSESARHVRYAIAGDIVPGQPEPREALAAAISGHGLADRVQLVGFRSDVREVMAALDVLVLPSTRPEPFGLVVVQAMACGKPVIATAHGGPLEIIVDGETGLLVPAADPVALADAIERLANDLALRARLGAAGRQRAVEKFGFGPHVAAFEQVYLAA